MKKQGFMSILEFNRYVTVWTAVMLLTSCSLSTQETKEFQPVQNVRLIVVDGEDERFLAMTAPLANHLCADGVIPYVLTGTTIEDIQKILPKEEIAKGKTIHITSEHNPDDKENFKGISVETAVVGFNPMKAGISLAKQYWNDLSTVVVAPTDQADALIQGAVLATHKGMPFIPVTSGRVERKNLKDFLRTSGVKHVFLVFNGNDQRLQWLPIEISEVCGLEILSPDKASFKTVEELGPESIRNVIVTRTRANDRDKVYAASFTAPYLSLIRKSPVILCDSSDYRQVESKVAGLLIEQCNTLRSVTILADHHMIGLHKVAEWNRDGYDAEVEACSTPETGVAFSLSVGRIPFKKPELILAIISRGVMSERNLTQRSFRALMIGNPNTSYGPLPLCETVARVTAEEFKNCRIAVDEYYGQVSTNPEMFKAVGKSQFIVFQGHITDLHFFGSSSEEKDDVFEQKWDECWIEETLTLDSDFNLNELACRLHNMFCPNTGGIELIPAQETLLYQTQQRVTGEVGNIGMPEPIKKLSGCPFVILQSCHSLEEPRANWIIRKGGIGLLGSTTNIHSASGSAFVKAFCDSLLYRGSTAGEALRDARNYFMCLDRLREQRGHKELAKMKRVAMSFRLWGDPEQRILPVMNGKPLIAVLSAELSGKRKLRIQTPLKKLKEAKTDKYVFRCFPSAEAGAIVTRLKGVPYRKIYPIYFFRLPTTDRFLDHEFTSIVRPADTDIRSIFIMDSLKRSFYILYYPAKEEKNGKYILEFRK